MTVKAKLELRGAAELQREMNAFGDKFVKKAAQKGAVKGAAHLRTQLRRAMSSQGLRITGKDGTKYNAVKLITTKRLKRPVKNAAGVYGWGSRVRTENILYVFEKGRRAYTDSLGRSFPAAPQLSRYRFYFSTVQREGPVAQQILIDHTRAQLREDWARVSTKVNALNKARGG